MTIERSDLEHRLDLAELVLESTAIASLGLFAEYRHAAEVWITAGLRRRARKARVWRGREFMGALKNLEYGFVRDWARSAGHRDGVFLVDRHHVPANAMMRKIYGRWLDRETDERLQVTALLGKGHTELQGVRIVGHHLRILGVMAAGPERDRIVLIDVDQEER